MLHSSIIHEQKTGSPAEPDAHGNMFAADMIKTYP